MTLQVCIYCEQPPKLDEQLTTEHVIPFALGGNETFSKASCKICGYRTSAFEAKVLRGAFYALREKLRLPSRTKDRPDTLPLFSVNGDEGRRVQIPLSEYPVTLPLPRYTKAKILNEVDFSAEPRKPWIFAESKDLSNLTDKYGIYQFATMSINSLSFGRMICKIGNSWVTKQLNGRQFFPFLQKIILEDRGYDFLNFVGISHFNAPPSGAGAIEHKLRLFEHPHELGRLLICEVTLFANLGAPTYHAIVGVLTDGTVVKEPPKFSRIKLPKRLRADEYRAIIKIDGSERTAGFDPFAPDVVGNFSIVD